MGKDWQGMSSVSVGWDLKAETEGYSPEKKVSLCYSGELCEISISMS